MVGEGEGSTQVSLLHSEIRFSVRDGAARLLTQKLGHFLAILDVVSSTLEGKLAEPIPLGKIGSPQGDYPPNFHEIGKTVLPKVVRFLRKGTLKNLLQMYLTNHA